MARSGSSLGLLENIGETMEGRCRGGGGGGGAPSGTVSFSKGIGQEKWIVDPDADLTGKSSFFRIESDSIIID